MTLEAYDPDRLDQLALRLHDLGARVRGLALACRQDDIATLPLHDRKTLDHLDRVEEWLCKAEAELPLARLKQRGQRAAQQATRRTATRRTAARDTAPRKNAARKK